MRRSTAASRPVATSRSRQRHLRAGDFRRAKSIPFFAAPPSPSSRRTYPAQHGLTVTELMDVAREVGLDPLAVRRSASIEQVGGTGALAAILGAPDRREVRATMHGGLPDDRRGLARAAENVLGRSGDILEDDPERFVWRESHGVGRTTVTVSGEGASDVSIVADRTDHYLVHWFLGLLGWAGLSVIAPFSVGPLAATLLWLVTPVLLARPF